MMEQQKRWTNFVAKIIPAHGFLASVSALPGSVTAGLLALLPGIGIDSCPFALTFR
jgi:hypothetical protein